MASIHCVSIPADSKWVRRIDELMRLPSMVTSADRMREFCDCFRRCLYSMSPVWLSKPHLKLNNRNFPSRWRKGSEMSRVWMSVIKAVTQRWQELPSDVIQYRQPPMLSCLSVKAWHAVSRRSCCDCTPSCLQLPGTTNGCAEYAWGTSEKWLMANTVVYTYTLVIMSNRN